MSPPKLVYTNTVASVLGASRSPSNFLFDCSLRGKPAAILWGSPLETPMWVSLEADLLRHSNNQMNKLRSRCSPSWAHGPRQQLNYTLMRDLEPEVPRKTTTGFLTRRNCKIICLLFQAANLGDNLLCSNWQLVYYSNWEESGLRIKTDRYIGLNISTKLPLATPSKILDNKL